MVSPFTQKKKKERKKKENHNIDLPVPPLKHDKTCGHNVISWYFKGNFSPQKSPSSAAFSCFQHSIWTASAASNIVVSRKGTFPSIHVSTVLHNNIQEIINFFNKMIDKGEWNAFYICSKNFWILPRGQGLILRGWIVTCKEWKSFVWTS